MKEWDFRYYEFIGFILISLILLFFLSPNHSSQIKEKNKIFFFKQDQVYNKNFKYKNQNFALNTKETILENKVLKIKISNLGGYLDEVVIKNFYDKNNKTLHLIQKNTSYFGFLFKDLQAHLYNTKYLYFFAKFQENINNISVIMRTYISKKSYIEYIYILDKYGYNLSFIVRSNGVMEHIKNNSIIFYWKQIALNLEKDKNWESNSTQMYFAYNNYDNVKYLSESNDDQKESNNVNWIAAKQQFFTSIISFATPLQKVHLKSSIINREKFIKNFEFYSPIKNKDIKLTSRCYFGPLHYDLLKSYNKNYEKIIPFGWGILRWLNTCFFLKIFQILNNTNLNEGIIIILMTIVVKLILCPITYKQYKLGAMMKIIRPELEKINNTYKKIDSLKKQQKIIELYKNTGINPMSGCLPALLQIPIFYSLFKFFPTLIELRSKSFLWVDDLTSYDAIYELPFYIPIYGNHISLFTLLYAIALLIYTKMSNTNTSEQGLPDMRPIMYLMPLMMLLFINNYAAGLSLYYFMSNLINIILIILMKKFFINDELIQQYIQYNKHRLQSKSIWHDKIQELINNIKNQKNNN